jgi:hypothetical protein
LYSCKAALYRPSQQTQNSSKGDNCL